jgi:hypothetical protein
LFALLQVAVLSQDEKLHMLFACSGRIRIQFYGIHINFNFHYGRETPRINKIGLRRFESDIVTEMAASGDGKWPGLASPAAIDTGDDAAIERFRSFLRFKSISNEGPSNGAYAQCVEFMRDLLRDAGLATEVVSVFAGRPVLIATLTGSQPDLPAVLLNSHYDVVPVVADKWTVDPWAATMTPDGKIYARGAQDMKCVCSAYVEAVLRLVRRDAGFKPKRTLHLTFMPDEEIGGVKGMYGK